MAKLLVTIDYMDGRTKVIEAYPDEIPLQGMLFKLSEREIAGITFTRAEPLTYLMKQSEKSND